MYVEKLTETIKTNFLKLLILLKAAPQRPLTYGLENRDFFSPKNNLSWKKLSQELNQDRLKKRTSNFVYKKGTKQFDGLEFFFNHITQGSQTQNYAKATVRMKMSSRATE